MTSSEGLFTTYNVGENYLLYIGYPLGEHLRKIKISNQKYKNVYAFPAKRIYVYMYYVVPKNTCDYVNSIYKSDVSWYAEVFYSVLLIHGFFYYMFYLV